MTTTKHAKAANNSIAANNTDQKRPKKNEREREREGEREGERERERERERNEREKGG